MSDFYEKIAKFRDEYQKNQPYTSYIRILPVLSQLINCAFTNESMPDVLPKEFIIRNVMLYKAELESLFEEIGLDVEINLTCNNFATGHSFEILQK